MNFAGGRGERFRRMCLGWKSGSNHVASFVPRVECRALGLPSLRRYTDLITASTACSQIFHSIKNASTDGLMVLLGIEDYRAKTRCGPHQVLSWPPATTPPTIWWPHLRATSCVRWFKVLPTWSSALD
jgi:hypothetical protein